MRGAPGHVCGLCDSVASGRHLPALYLARGLKRGDKCVLVAPAETQNAILAALPDRRKALCIAADMSRTLSRNLRIDAVVEIEKRFDALAKPLSVTGLCVYDTRRFSSGDFLQALKCHRDHARHPIALG